MERVHEVAQQPSKATDAELQWAIEDLRFKSKLHLDLSVRVLQEMARRKRGENVE